MEGTPVRIVVMKDKPAIAVSPNSAKNIPVITPKGMPEGKQSHHHQRTDNRVGKAMFSFYPNWGRQRDKDFRQGTPWRRISIRIASSAISARAVRANESNVMPIKLSVLWAEVYIALRLEIDSYVFGYGSDIAES